MRTQQEKANAILARAEEHRRRGSLDLAIDAYREAIRLVPAYGSLNRHLGDLLFEKKAYTEAAEAYSLALEFIPADPQALTALGRCRLLLGEHAQALEFFDRVLETDPESPEANYYGALLYAREKETRKASRLLQTALRRKPEWAEHAAREPLLQPLLGEAALDSDENGRPWWKFWGRES